MSIVEIRKKYYKKISPLDLEILISHAIGKKREFVLAHPEYALRKTQNAKLETFIERRMQSEPIAYITGHKEFYGLDFKVNKHTLIPRPETELMVDLVLKKMHPSNCHSRESGNLDSGSQTGMTTIADIGSGSGNIIISIAKNRYCEKMNHLLSPWRGEGVQRTDEGKKATSIFEYTSPSPQTPLPKEREEYYLFATDISKDALKIAKKNAKEHGVREKIKFIQGSLLAPISKKLMKLKANKLILIANLPYLSEEIYKSSPDDVKKYEPKTALYSDNYGLSHYEELLKQISLLTTHYGAQTTILLEISPEQKQRLEKIIKKLLPNSKTKFYKDLAHKWRICEIEVKL